MEVRVPGNQPEIVDPEEWWSRLFLFVVGIPVTLIMVLLEGERLWLLPAPVIAVWAIARNFVVWRRQRYWTPRIIHVMAALAFLTIVAINVDWVRAGGSMWIQRYVVIVVCAMVPYFIYLTLGGPRYMANHGRVPVKDEGREAAGSQESGR